MAAPTFVSVGAQNSGTTGMVTYAIGSGVVAGDTMLTAIESADTAGASNASMGWSTVANSPRAQGSNVTSVSVFSRVYVTLEAGFLAGGAANHQTGALASYRGAGPIASTVAASNNGTAVTSGTVTTTVDDCRVVLIAVWAAATATPQFSSIANASLTGVTSRYQAGTTNGNGGGVLIVDGVKTTAGAVSAWTATLATSQAWAALVLVLPPAAASLEASGTAPVTSASTGSITATLAAVGAAAVVTAASGAITANHPLTGFAPVVSAATGSPTANVGVSGSAAATSAATGAPTANKSLSGATAVTTGATGTIASRQGLTGAANAVSGTAGALVNLGPTTYPLTGNVTVSTSSSGAVTARHPLAGSAAATTGSAGVFTKSAAVAGQVVLTGGSKGTITVRVSLAGAAVATSGSTGTLTTTSADVLPDFKAGPPAPPRFAPGPMRPTPGVTPSAPRYAYAAPLTDRYSPGRPS